MTVTISAGTCRVDVSPSSPPLLIVTDADMAGGGVHGGTAVSVMTTNCLGVGETSKTPSVQVTGMTYDLVNPASAGAFTAGQYLFTSPASAVKWAGFVLSKTETGAVAWDANADATYVKNSEIVPFDGSAAGDTCGGATECSITFWAGLACGTVVDCASHFGQKDNDGPLSASIVFTFLYN
ncbi:UNVERIFIED_ORG: hypothetical protein M2414_005145 [Rahnella aquatilis]